MARAAAATTLVRWLIDNGSSPADVDVVGNTALLYAVYGGHRPVVEGGNAGHAVFEEVRECSFLGPQREIGPARQEHCRLDASFEHICRGGDGAGVNARGGGE